MPTGVDDRRDHDLEQRVEPGNGFLGGVRLGEGREIADVDEHHRYFAALAGEDVVTLLEQARRQRRVDVGPERRLKPLPLSQSGLHPVERRGEGTEVIVLHHRQTLAVIPRRNAFGAFSEIPNRSQGRPKDSAERNGQREAHSEYGTDHHPEHRTCLTRSTRADTATPDIENTNATARMDKLDHAANVGRERGRESPMPV